jgi:PAS domain S-box-containing protein
MNEDPSALSKEQLEQANIKLAELNARLEQFLENASDLVMLITPKLRLLYANPAWYALLGYTTAQARHSRVGEVVKRSYWREFVDTLYTLSPGDTVMFRTVLLSKSGVEIVVKASFSGRYDPATGALQEYQGILFDITAQEQSEKAQRIALGVAAIGLEVTRVSELYERVYTLLFHELQIDKFIVARKENETIFTIMHSDENPTHTVLERSFYYKKTLIDFCLTKDAPILYTQAELFEYALRGDFELPCPMGHGWLSVPFEMGNGQPALLALQPGKELDAFDPWHKELLKLVASQLAVALRKRQSEEALTRQSARLEAIFDSASHLIFTVDARRKLTGFNANFAATYVQITGSKPKLKTSPEALFSVAERKQFANLVDRALNGHSEHIQVHTEPNGHKPMEWFEVFANPIKLEGRYEQVTLIAHHVSAKKKAELQLIASERRFRNIYESFTDIYFKTDKAGRLMMVSPSVKDICGYEPASIIGKKISEFYIYRYSIKRSLKELLRKRRLRDFELVIVTKEGTMLTIVCNVRIFLDPDSGRLAYEGVARDMSSLRQANKELLEAKLTAERSLKVKDKFLANMSHEIRTPMNGVIGIIDLLHRTSLTEHQRDYVDTIRNSSQTLMAILNDILDLSKIEAGKMTIKRSSFNLPRMLSKVKTLFLQPAAAKGITLELDYAPHLPTIIRTDETRLIQVLSNLISNAIKFTEEGSVRVVVTESKQKGTNWELVFRIIDTGIGIAETNMPMLFGAFNQVDTGTTKAYGGTGLGLAISRQLIEGMGGQIQVTSTEGEGSEFSFTLPVKAGKEVEAQQVIELAHIDDVEFEPLSVLLTDDNATNRKVARQLLISLNMEVVEAADGFEAVWHCQRSEFDLILLDIQMPHQDGIESLHLIRNGDGKNTTTRAVAMTAYSMKEDRAKYINAGFDDYVPKPITRDSLAQMLSRVQGVVYKTSTQAVHYLEKPIEKAGSVFEITLQDFGADTQIIAQLVKLLGEDGLKQTYEEFAVEASELIQKLDGTLENALHVFHTIKGTAATLGLTTLAKPAFELEQQARTGNFTPDSELERVLRRDINKFANFTSHKR